MANTIDLATYTAKFVADTSGIDDGFGKADVSMKDKLGGLISWSKLAVGGAIAAVVVGVGKLVASGVKATAELDENMSKFQATTGATGKEVEEVRKLAQELYKSNTDSMEDIVATSEAMKQAMGLTTEEIKGSQQAFMDFAKTTGQNNVDVIKAIDDIGDAWGLSLDEMVGATDMFKKSSEMFGTDIAGVQKAMQQLAPASKALGLGFEETNGLMNMMAESGLDASSAVTALNYAAKTVESPEQFKQMMEDIQAIEDPTQRTQEAIELFGARAGVAMSSMLDGTTNLDDFMISMEEAEGTVNSASSAFDSNFNVQLELTKKMFSGLTQELGDRFMPAIGSVLEWVNDKMPVIQNAITVTFDAIGDVFDFFIDTIKFVVEVIKEFASDNMNIFDEVKETISLAFDFIVEIVNFFIEAFKVYWDLFGEYVMTYIKVVWDMVSGVFKGALDTIKGILNFFISMFKGDWKGMGDALKQITKGLWDAISSMFKGYIGIIKNILNAAITTLSNIAKAIMDGIFNAFKSVWDNITSWISDSFSKLARTITNFGSTFYNVGKDIFSSVWDGLKGVWSDISGWVSDKVSWISDKLQFWKKSEKEMDSSSSSSTKATTLSAPAYATGTNFVPNDGLAFLHKGEAVIPAHLNQGSPYQGGRPITIQQGNIELNVEGNLDRSILPEVKKMIDSALNSNNERTIIELNKGGTFRKMQAWR